MNDFEKSLKRKILEADQRAIDVCLGKYPPIEFHLVFSHKGATKNGKKR